MYVLKIFFFKWYSPPTNSSAICISHIGAYFCEPRDVCCWKRTVESCGTHARNAHIRVCVTTHTRTHQRPLQAIQEARNHHHFGPTICYGQKKNLLKFFAFTIFLIFLPRFVLQCVIHSCWWICSWSKRGHVHTRGIKWESERAKEREKERKKERDKRREKEREREREKEREREREKERDAPGQRVVAARWRRRRVEATEQLSMTGCTTCQCVLVSILKTTQYTL